MAKIKCTKCGKVYPQKEMYFVSAAFTINRKNVLSVKNQFQCDVCAPQYVKEVSVAWNL